MIWLCGLALGADLDAGADVKVFAVGVVLPEPLDPFSSSVLDVRGKLDAEVGPLDGELHGTAGAGAADLPLGVGLGEDELVDLSWSGDYARARIDRASVRYRRDHLDVRVGRQPVSFGTGYIFRPMDLVAAFSGTEVDQEYKPGVDAARVDAYAGVSNTMSLVLAYDRRALVYGQTTLRGWDVGAMGAALDGWRLAGLVTSGAVGPVGVRAEATVDADQEVRAALGLLPRGGGLLPDRASRQLLADRTELRRGLGVLRDRPALERVCCGHRQRGGALCAVGARDLLVRRRQRRAHRERLHRPRRAPRRLLRAPVRVRHAPGRRGARHEGLVLRDQRLPTPSWLSISRLPI